MLDLPTTEGVEPSSFIHISTGGVDFKIRASDLIASIQNGGTTDVNPVEIADPTYTIQFTDRDNYIEFTNDSGADVTLPNSINAPLPVRSQFTVANRTNGVVNFLLDTNVELRAAVTGASLDTYGQAATFINMGTNDSGEVIWSMLSGGVGSGEGTIKPRFKQVRAADTTRTDDSTVDLLADATLVVSGLTGGSTYEISCTLFVENTGTTPAEIEYYVGAPTYNTTPAGDYSTHMDSTGSIVSSVESLSPNNTVTVAGGSTTETINIIGEVTVPSGENQIALYWDSVANTETVTLKQGSTLVVQTL